MPASRDNSFPAGDFPSRLNDSLHTSQLRVVVHLYGFLVPPYSFSTLPPMFIVLLNKERSLFTFFSTFMTFFTPGGGVWLAAKHAGIQLCTRDGFVITVLFWPLFSFIGAMLMRTDDGLNLSLTDALFEGVSGITTIGATVIDDVSTLSKSYLYYQAQLNFTSGLGAIVLVVAVLPLLGIGGMKLYQSEMPGPFKEGRLTPRLADTVRTLWMTYVILGLICTLAYWAVGMSFFDVLCHGLSTVPLGGFSTRSESIGSYNSHIIELAVGIFSLLSASNFTLWHVAIVKRIFKPFRRNAELHFFLPIALVVTLIVTRQVWRADVYGLTDGLVHAFLLASSMLTDNGLSTAGYAQWSPHTIFMLLSASFFGGCVESTCGGTKVLRFLTMFKQCRQELHQLAHPRALLNIKVGNSVVGDWVVCSVWSFLFLYVLFTSFFIWVLNLMGYDLFSSFAAAAACINNMGLGFGVTATTFGTLNEEAKLLMCAAMITGRLETYPIPILFSRMF